MGERILVDTDSLIDYYREKLDLEPEHIYSISEITIYEFIRGTKNVGEAKKIIEESFSTVWLDNRIIEKASEIWRDLRKRGETVEDRDIVIAATAIVKGLKLLTRNTRHYNRLQEYGLSFYGG